jgi:hypothetical protein
MEIQWSKNWVHLKGITNFRNQLVKVEHGTVNSNQQPYLLVPRSTVFLEKQRFLHNFT